MQQYSPVKLEWWQIQPIHNYFLLAAAEIGIIGALILIWIFFWHLRHLSLRIKDSSSAKASDMSLRELGTGPARPAPRITISDKQGLRIEPIALIAILISFLILMQFDHYFYTLQQTQMLLWIVLGIIAAEIQKPETINWVPNTIQVLQNTQTKNSP